MYDEDKAMVWTVASYGCVGTPDYVIGLTNHSLRGQEIMIDNRIRRTELVLRRYRDVSESLNKDSDFG